MKFIVMLALFFSISIASADNSSFVNQVEYENLIHTPFKNYELEKVQSAQFILVDGLLGDIIKISLHPAKDVIQKEWKNPNVTIIRPSSENVLLTNADLLYNKIKSIRSLSSHRRAVIVAHSKGGGEVLLMLVRHPDLISKYGVVALGLVQSVVGGTELADLVEDVCDGSSVFEGVRQGFCDFLVNEVPCLRSMEPAHTQPLFEEAIAALTPQQKTAIKEIVFYVRSEMMDFDIFSPLSIPHFYLSHFHAEAGPNDGIIPTGNERLLINGEVFGTDLGVFEGDHNSLLANTSDPLLLDFRQTFFRELIRTIYISRVPN